MKTKYIVKGLVKNNLVYFVGLKDEILWDKKQFEVRTCSSTIDGATMYDSYDEALYVIRECELHGFDAYPVCPNCGEDYSEHPAISRKDNQTELCSNCGLKEALIIFKNNSNLL